MWKQAWRRIVCSPQCHPMYFKSLQESMRLQPVAANSLRRIAVRDVRLSNGVVLPAGVSIEVAQYSMFRNPAWGWKNPNAYLPVRPLSIKLISDFQHVSTHFTACQ